MTFGRLPKLTMWSRASIFRTVSELLSKNSANPTLPLTLLLLDSLLPFDIDDSEDEELSVSVLVRDQHSRAANCTDLPSNTLLFLSSINTCLFFSVTQGEMIINEMQRVDVGYKAEQQPRQQLNGGRRQGEKKRTNIRTSWSVLKENRMDAPIRVQQFFDRAVPPDGIIGVRILADISVAIQTQLLTNVFVLFDCHWSPFDCSSLLMFRFSRVGRTRFVIGVFDLYLCWSSCSFFENWASISIAENPSRTISNTALNWSDSGMLNLYRLSDIIRQYHWHRSWNNFVTSCIEFLNIIVAKSDREFNRHNQTLYHERH